MSIQRYALDTDYCDNSGACGSRMLPHADGDWVKVEDYEDVEADRDQLQKCVDKLEKLISDFSWDSDKLIRNL